MNTTRISEQDASGLAHGRVPGRSDLNPLADLLAEYRSAAIGSAPRPSAALAAKLDLSATPIAMQRVNADEKSSGVGIRRTASGLFGVGVTVTIILAAASGAAAVVGAGSAGVLPPGAQDAFDQVVSTIVPPGVAGTETTDQGEVPGDSSVSSPAPQTPGGTPSVAPDDSTTKVDDSTVSNKPDTGNANGDVNGSGNANSNSNGNGNSENAGNGNSGSGNGNSGNGNSGNGNGNPDSSNGNSGNGNSGNGNSGNGNGNSGNGNSGNGNSGHGNSENGKSGKDD